MRALVYVDLANHHRGPIAAGLARSLAAAGWDVLALVETGVVTELAGRYAAWPSTHLPLLTKSPKWRTQILETFSEEAGGSEQAFREQDLRRRYLLEEHLPKDAPDRIFVFNGEFSHQRGFRDVIAARGWADRLMFHEVAWFPQKEFIYFDSKGVNRNSSLVSRTAPELSALQLEKLEGWKRNYLSSNAYGGSAVERTQRRIFVPLQVDSDTTIRLFSPFPDMRAFIRHMEDWVPEGWEVLFKTHPKATYDYHLQSSRAEFRFTAEGGVHEHMAQADMVVGVNSTVLLEAALIGKPVVALGEGIYTGGNVVLELPLDAPFPDEVNIDSERRNAFFYDLVFRHQVNLGKLARGDAAHLMSREAFQGWPTNKKTQSRIPAINATEARTMIKIGHSQISKTASLDVTHQGQIVIGDNCEVRHHAVLEVIGRYNGAITIGDNCVIGICNWLQGAGDITIGNDVIIGPYTCIISSDHTFDDPNIPVARLPLKTSPVVIEDDVWIGAHVTITNGVVIGAHSIIGANTFVNRDIPAYSIAVGSPARVIRTRK